MTFLHRLVIVQVGQSVLLRFLHDQASVDMGKGVNWDLQPLLVLLAPEVPVSVAQLPHVSSLEQAHDG